MTVLAQLLIAAALVATAVIYGTDVFAAIVLRPALAQRGGEETAPVSDSCRTSSSYDTPSHMTAEIRHVPRDGQASGMPPAGTGHFCADNVHYVK